MPSEHDPGGTRTPGSPVTRGLAFMRPRRMLQRTHHEDPMSMMANLFDVALLMGVGLLIMGLSSFGLGDLLTKNDMTVVTNPGKKDQKIITRTNGNIEVLTQTGDTASGQGVPVGTVYRLQNGQYVWMPNGSAP